MQLQGVYSVLLTDVAVQQQCHLLLECDSSISRLLSLCVCFYVYVCVYVSYSNFAVMMLKLLAYCHTGSATMLSEAVHSLADLINQVSVKFQIELIFLRGTIVAPLIPMM